MNARNTLIALTLCTLPLTVFAHQTSNFAFGAPGKAADVNRTIHVKATDQMRFLFDSQTIRRGDVVRFVITNTGVIPHEFGIGDAAFQHEHAQEMMKMPGMMHDDPNVVSLKPGETRTLIWSFKKVRNPALEFACNVPGHYAAGMVTRLTLK